MCTQGCFEDSCLGRLYGQELRGVQCSQSGERLHVGLEAVVVSLVLQRISQRPSSALSCALFLRLLRQQRVGWLMKFAPHLYYL